MQRLYIFFLLLFIKVLRGEESGPLTQLLLEYGARCDIMDDNGNSAETVVQSLMTRYGNTSNVELCRSYQRLLELLWESQGEISLKERLLSVIIDLDIIIWPIFFVFMSLGQYLAILTKNSLVNKGFIVNCNCHLFTHGSLRSS